MLSLKCNISEFRLILLDHISHVQTRKHNVQNWATNLEHMLVCIHTIKFKFIFPYINTVPITDIHADVTVQSQISFLCIKSGQENINKRLIRLLCGWHTIISLLSMMSLRRVRSREFLLNSNLISVHKVFPKKIQIRD